MFPPNGIKLSTNLALKKLLGEDNGKYEGKDKGKDNDKDKDKETAKSFCLPQIKDTFGKGKDKDNDKGTD